MNGINILDTDTTTDTIEVEAYRQSVVDLLEALVPVSFIIAELQVYLERNQMAFDVLMSTTIDKKTYSEASYRLSTIEQLQKKIDTCTENLNEKVMKVEEANKKALSVTQHD